MARTVERICGTCGTVWQPSFNYCPSDGSKLVSFEHMTPLAAAPLSRRPVLAPIDAATDEQVLQRSGLLRNPVHRFYKRRDAKAFVETANHLRPAEADGDIASTGRPRFDDDEAGDTQRSRQLLRGGGDGVR